MQFDRSKLKAAILWTCHACPADRLGAVKMHKVLYFLDMLHYAQHGSPVTGATYRKRPYGPTCVPLLPMLAEMEADGDLEIRTVDYHGYRKTEYIPRMERPLDVLRQTEIDLLDDIVDFVCDRNTAKTISDFSHQAPWDNVGFGEVIPYHSAYLLLPAQVSPEAFDMTARGKHELEKAGSDGDAVVFADFAGLRRRMGAVREGD